MSERHERLPKIESRVKIKFRLISFIMSLLTLLTIITSAPAFAEPDVTSWSSHSSPGGNSWTDIAYGNGIFVAVADGGDGQRVMTSENGVDWILHTPIAGDLSWKSITFGNGLFVAVAYTGAGNRVMTSTDGITWTSRTPSSSISWWSVTFGNGLFVAVSNGGVGNRVMTSPDGITWTGRTASISAQWTAVTYGNELFVAVGFGSKVMTSPDGSTWTTRNAAGIVSDWNDVAFGGGQFVAVGDSGDIVRSSNGITWVDSASPGHKLVAVTYGDGHFVALDQDVTFIDRFETVAGVTAFVATDIAVANTPQLVTSTDARTWLTQTAPHDSNWSSVVFGNGRFVAVSSEGYGDRTMRSAIVAVAAPTPDPAAIEAARLADERAAIAEAARIRQIEIDKFKKLLFAKLVRGERPELSDYNNATLNQVTKRNIELVTDRVLALSIANRSEFDLICAIANDVAYWDTFFNPMFRPTIAEYGYYGITGVTERTLKAVNERVLQLPISKQSGRVSIQEIATEENFVDRIANPLTRTSISSTLLISKGLLSAQSPYKFTVVRGLASYPESSLNSIAKIAAAIKAEIAKAEAPKLRLAAIKAKIAARNK